MKKHLAFFALFSCLLFSSCLDVNEQIWLEKNGAGRYELKLNFQSLRHLATFVKIAHLAGKGDAIDLEKMPVFDREMRLSELPDSVKKRLPHGDLLSKIGAEIHMNASKRKFNAEFEMAFDRPEDIEKFYQILEEFSQRSQKMLDLEGIAGTMMLKNRPSFSLENGVFTRKTGGSKGGSLLGKLFGQGETMERLFGRADYSLTYRMPSKVTWISNKTFKKRCKKIKKTIPMNQLGRGDMNFSAILKK